MAISAFPLYCRARALIRRSDLINLILYTGESESDLLEHSHVNKDG